MSSKDPLRIAAIRRMFKRLSMRPREMALIVLLTGLYALFEGFGIGLLLPILEFVEAGSTVPSNAGWVWQSLSSAARTVGLPLSLVTLLMMALIPIMLRQVVQFANIWYTAVVQARAVTRLRSEGFGALLDGDVSFAAAHEHGYLVSWLTLQANRAGQALLNFVKLIADAVLILAYVVILFLLQPTLMGIAIIAIGAISVLARWNVKRARELGKQSARLSNQTMAMIDERVRALRLIKMLGQEERETGLVTDSVRELERIQVKTYAVRGLMEMMIDPALMVAAFLIIYVGVEILGGTLATLGVFLFILLRLNQKAKDFNVNRQYLATFLESLEFVYGLIEEARSSRGILGGKTGFDALSEGISFQNVSFSYTEGEPAVLDGVSLDIARGALVALVGKSGAGKSTLADLIPRLRDATSGQVLIDSSPIQDFDLRSLRRRIGFMGQDAIMFNESVRANLVYGLERDPDDEEVWAALRDAYAEDFVRELPDALETRIGDDGGRLSGGQRQRLALARVLLQDPDVLILDEPTSALDSESELYIQKALADMKGKKTLVVIAHRLSTVQGADEILVLESGRIVERGTHAALLERGEVYLRLFETQINA